MLKSLGHALNGLKAVLGAEQNFRTHLLAALLAIFLGFWLRISRMEWVWVTACITVVMSAEAMNTAIEKLSDALHPGYHEKIKTVKDIAAGAVLIVSAGALVIGAIIFVPHLVRRFSFG